MQTYIDWKSNTLRLFPLGVLYLFTAASVVGFAVFGLHPEHLVAFPRAVPIYTIAFTWFARTHVVLAFLVLALMLQQRVGGRWVLAFCALYVLSLMSELLGTTVGIPFGAYHYTNGLGIKWFGHVPVVIPLSWFTMAIPSYALVGWGLGQGQGQGEPARRGLRAVCHVLLGALVLVCWDFALDPAMSQVTHYWVWREPHSPIGMPFSNLVGWYATGVVLMAALAALRADTWLHFVDRRWMAAFYGANFLLPLGLGVSAGWWWALVASVLGLACCWFLTRTVSRSLA